MFEFKGFASDCASSQLADEVLNSNTPTHSNRPYLSSSSSTPQFSLLTTTNSQCSSPAAPTLAFQAQSPNASFTASQTSSSSASQQTAASQSQAKLINNNMHTPKQATPTQASIQTQPNLFSVTSMSPPNSPKTINATSVLDEIVYNLQLDYWTAIGPIISNNTNNSEQVLGSQPLQSISQQMVVSSVSSQKITQKAWFRSLHVFRTQLVVPTTIAQGVDVAQSLTLVYQIKEKKQKSV